MGRADEFAETGLFPTPQELDRAVAADPPPFMSPSVYASLMAGAHESLDIAYGPADKPILEGDFPGGVGIKSMPDYPAMEVANALVMADQGLVSERNAEALPRIDKAKSKIPEGVVTPEHYARFPVEPIFFIVENRLPFAVGNVIKYILRWDAKDGIKDLYKAQRYLDMLIKFVEGDRDWWKKPTEPADPAPFSPEVGMRRTG